MRKRRQIPHGGRVGVQIRDEVECTAELSGRQIGGERPAARGLDQVRRPA
jgi:hypothetical protein